MTDALADASTSADRVAAFLSAAAEQQMGGSGPHPGAVAVARAVALARQHTTAPEGGGVLRVAVPSADPLLEALGVRDALRAAGLVLLEAGDPGWTAAIGTAAVGVTGAALGVVETGTLVLPCGPGRPRGTHIVPPAHVCLIRAADLVTTFAAAIERVGRAPLPSNLSWVGGPSRTADLEMRPTLGIHGPKAVDVVVVGAGEDAGAGVG